MIQVHPADRRGHSDHGWLAARHTCSFGRFHDPARMGFRALRVINEDVIAPSAGFGKHPHRDMEILTYVLEGRLAHSDSMGHTSVIRPGHIQRMSAGTGVQHAEHNASETASVHLLQVWLEPDAAGYPPSYEELDLGPDGAHDRLALIATPEGADGATTWHADARLFAARPTAGTVLLHELAPGRHAWVQIARGRIVVNGVVLGPGDGAAVSEESRLACVAKEDAEFLLFDLA